MFFTRRSARTCCRCAARCRARCSGAERVTEELSKELGIGVERDRRRSGEFTLMEMECLGACDRAPVVMVNNEYWHECQRPEDAGAWSERALRQARGLWHGARPAAIYASEESAP